MDTTTDVRRRLYTVRELEALLQCKRSTAYALMRGPLARDVVRIGRLVRVPADAVDRWLDEQRGA